MNQRLSVAEEENKQANQPIREQMDQLQQSLREAKIASGLDPDEELVSEDELDWTPIDYQPHEWKAPEERPAAPELNPPWETWVEWYVETETQTILDLVTEMDEVRVWWTPYMEFHRLVASKLMVMEWVEDPKAVTIEATKLQQLSPAEQFNQLLRLDQVVQEVREFQKDTETRTLIGSLEEFAQRRKWTAFSNALEEHRSQQT